MNTNIKSPSPYQLLKTYFTIKSVKTVYDSKIKFKTAKGIDRINAEQFSRQSQEQFKIISRKCLSGTYKFSPYLELLQSKGRCKYPRIIAIPTIRDRIVLHLLKEILAKVFPECVQKKLANAYIYEIGKYTSKILPAELGIFRTDIQNFYGEINRNLLLNKIRSRIKSQKVLTLLKRAIEAPIVPKDYKKYEVEKFQTPKGIPQGLSISNILAAIYLLEFDEYMENTKCKYFRYVDDILIIEEINKINELENLAKEKIKELNLSFHNNGEKTHSGKADQPFDYLGYHFELPLITVRQSTIERFLHSVVAKFSNYIHNRESRLKKYDYLTPERLQEIFILELNEKITGAINEQKRYGWVFYFNAINDIAILHKIDFIISGLFERLQDFEGKAPKSLKKLSRSFYEAKYSPDSGYIHNYNNYSAIEQKREFLVQWGKLDPNENASEEKILTKYDHLKFKNLLDLEKDDAIIY